MAYKNIYSAILRYLNKARHFLVSTLFKNNNKKKIINRTEMYLQKIKLIYYLFQSLTLQNKPGNSLIN